MSKKAYHHAGSIINLIGQTVEPFPGGPKYLVAAVSFKNLYKDGKPLKHLKPDVELTLLNELKES